MSRDGRQEPILGVTFDLDDTLYDNRPVMERAEAVLQGWLAREYPRVVQEFSLQALRELRKAVAAEHRQLSHDLTAIRKLALAKAAQACGYPPRLADEALEVFHEARNQVQVYEDVRPVLHGLRRRYVLGALSNGNADIGRIGLDDLFHFAISAVDVGAAKPEPPMFQAAVRRIGTLPARVIHVGDDPVRDVEGAAAAGLRTVWVNRWGHDWPGGRRADAEIVSLLELPGVLGEL